jgi:hypothetical protein
MTDKAKNKLDTRLSLIIKDKKKLEIAIKKLNELRDKQRSK